VGICGPNSCHSHSCHPSTSIFSNMWGDQNNLQQACRLRVHSDAEPFTRGFHLSSRRIPRDCTVVNPRIALVSRVLQFRTIMVPIINICLCAPHHYRPIRKKCPNQSTPLRPDALPSEPWRVEVVLYQAKERRGIPRRDSKSQESWPNIGARDHGVKGAVTTVERISATRFYFRNGDK
jgi:hypothetical protein